MILDREYYSANADVLAPDLLGKLLCRRTSDGAVLRMRITETECYLGEEDTACHASRGRTKRTETLYLPGGYTYVYLCYGIHSLLNVVTGPAEHPQAVLIRGVEGYPGPGRLTKALAITTADNGLLLSENSGVWIEDDGVLPRYSSRPRIGIDYATKEYREKKWNFTVEL